MAEAPLVQSTAARTVGAPAVHATPSVKGVYALPVKPVARRPQPVAFKPTATAWPSAATGTVTLAGGTSTASTTPVRAKATTSGKASAAAMPQAGSASGVTAVGPVSLRPSSAYRGPGDVQVAIASRQAAVKAGVDGVLFTLTPRGAGQGAAALRLDYSSFAQAYGASFGARLHLVELPACALTTPQLASCRTQHPLEATNSATGEHLDATLPLRGGSAPASAVGTAARTTTAGAQQTSTVTGSPMVLAAVSGASAGDGGGPGGTYAATTLKASGSWSGGDSNGSWTYNYPISVPAAGSALQPQLSLNYDSGSIDGQTAASQAQASWIGDGWSSPQSFIEQSFVSCSDDPEGSASPVSTGDDCYDGPVLTLSLDGGSVSLIKDSQGNWHTSDDNGDVVTHVTGSNNGQGTYNTDYWKVTDRTGTTYYFGLNHLPGWSSGKAATDSVDTVPVYSAHSGDPCYNSAGFTSSVCTMGYRYNLDYVTDVHGNAMAYYYHQDTNYYGEDNGAHDVSYVRDSHLDHVDYGFTNGNAYGTIPDKVLFATGDRCFAGASSCDPLNSTTAPNWPDVPFDLVCNSGSTCSGYSPAFFSTVRLASITTEQWNTTLATPGYSTVDSYPLTQSMPATGDSGSDLWLSSIGHTGSDPRAGGSATPVTLPSVSFTSVTLPNRVDTSVDGLPPLYRFRIATVTNESGGVTDVSYGQTSACTSPVTISPSANTSSCYPVYWTPQGYTAPILDWFNKYVVTGVKEVDSTGGSAGQQTSYHYSGAAWHYDDNELVQAKYRTYGQWRGYQDVKTFTGDGVNDKQTESETTYYQGMSDDNNSTAVTLTDSQGGKHDDNNLLAGDALEHTSYLGSGGPVDQSTITSYWISPATASRTRTGLPDLTANKIATAEVWTRQADTDKGGGSNTTWTVNETDTTYDATASDANFGLPLYSYSHTVPANTAYDRCTTTGYAPANTTANLVGLPSETETDSVACGGFTEGTVSSVPSGLNTLTAPTNVNRPTQVVSATRTIYDDPTDAVKWPQPAYTFPQATAPTLGEPSITQKAAGYNADGTANWPNWTTTGTQVFDSTGRVTGAYNADGAKSATAYTTDSVGLVTGTTTTNPLGQTSSTTLDPARNLTLTATDPNGVVTTSQYDTLGRLTSVWKDSRATSLPANITYAYTVSDTGTTAVTTNTLNDASGVTTSTLIYDALMRPRQTQASTPQGGRLVTDTFYDTHGWKSAIYNGWWDSATGPNTTIVSAADLKDDVPSQDFYTYDGLGRAVIDQSENDGAEVSRTTTVYNGDRTTVIPGTAPIPSSGVIPAGGGTVKATVTDPLGRTTEVDSYTADPTLNTPSDTFAGIWTVSNGTTQPITYGYDSHGNQNSTASGGETWGSTYNLLGQVVSKTDPTAGTSTMQYDPAGLLLQTTNANTSNNTVSYTYDALGRQTASYAAPASGQSASNKLTSNVYDNSNNAVTGMKDAVGHVTTATSYSGGAATAVTQAMGFNVFGESVGEKYTVEAGTSVGALAGTYTFQHSYSSTLGLPQKSTFPAAGGMGAETVAYGYTGAFDLPSSIGGLNTYASSTSYDAYSRVTQETLGTGTTTEAFITNTYDPHTSQLTDQLVTRSTATPTAVDEQHYAYDTAGNITQQVSTRLGATTATETQCYQYDGLNRLTQAWTATDSCAATPTPTSRSTVGDQLADGSPYWTAWTFTPLGQRQTETDYSTTGGTDTTVNYAYANANQPNTLSSTTATGGSTATTSYTYDNTGNTITRDTPGSGNQTLSWNADGQLTQISGGTAGTTNYVYGPDGKVLLQEDAGSTTLYLPDEPLTLTGTTVTGNRYYTLPGGGTAVRTGNGSTSSYDFEIADQHGTSGLLLDSTGQTPTWRQFTPYGATRGSTVTWTDNRGFLNAPADPNTGLTILGARQYDPTLGQFISLDPLFEATDSQQLNGYTYSADDPINGSDPSGLAYGQWITDGEHPAPGGEENGQAPDPSIVRDPDPDPNNTPGWYTQHHYYQSDLQNQIWDAFAALQQFIQQKELAQQAQAAAAAQDTYNGAECGHLGINCQGTPQLPSGGGSLSQFLDVAGSMTLHLAETLAGALGGVAGGAGALAGVLACADGVTCPATATAATGSAAFSYESFAYAVNSANSLGDDISTALNESSSEYSVPGLPRDPDQITNGPGDCKACAEKIQQSLGGGELKMFVPPRFFGPYQGQDTMAWTHHWVVVKDGMVYDAFTPRGGLPVNEYKDLWEYGDAINFGF